MIDLILPPQTKELMAALGITEQEAITTLNDRHSGLADNGLTRIAAVHWFSRTRIIFLDGPITKKRQETENGRPILRFEEVTAGPVIELRPELPAGKIDRGMEMKEILPIVAMSFGIEISADPHEPASKFYNGRGDNKQISIKSSEKERTYMVCGSFDHDKKTASMLYALDVDKYLNWFMFKGSS